MYLFFYFAFAFPGIGWESVAGFCAPQHIKLRARVSCKWARREVDREIYGVTREISLLLVVAVEKQVKCFVISIKIGFIQPGLYSVFWMTTGWENKQETRGKNKKERKKYRNKRQTYQ